ncbi:hypothetical protein GGX14DRAFT_608011 [Mycena pura]|uniref:Uncharacterized protein n=1 Tax=Mycena pura TaxID=153505 RepID=A0AAD6VJV1_9AGAR|nr:hypothetical protein GGX14DRAFT_608011 [Mycena pura]
MHALLTPSEHQLCSEMPVIQKMWRELLRPALAKFSIYVLCTARKLAFAFDLLLTTHLLQVPSRPMHLMSAAAVLLFVSRRRPARPRHWMALLLLPFSTGRRRHWQFLELEATGATRCERAGRHHQAARRRWWKAPDARAMRLCLEYVHST